MLCVLKCIKDHVVRGIDKEGYGHLQHAAHPLEAVLLGGVRPLLRHHHDPLIVEHGHGKHRYPGDRTA